MRPTKTLRLLWEFYKKYAFAAMVCDGISIYVFYTIGLWSLTLILCLKVLSSVCMVGYLNSYKKSDFYYYQNLGLSKLFLWRTTLLADFLLLIVLLVITAQCP